MTETQPGYEYEKPAEYLYIGGRYVPVDYVNADHAADLEAATVPAED